MSVLRGHEDLKPKAIVGFDMGFALVQCGTSVQRYRLMVGPGGNLMARPEEEERNSVDQIGSEHRARRFHGIDQL
jgi:hypothetical protein